MLHFHVHNKVSLKTEHIDLSKPLFITLKVCINFRFSNLNLAQCWLWPATQHSVLRRKATLIFVSKILQRQKIVGFSINSVWTLEKISKAKNFWELKIFLACTKALVGLHLGTLPTQGLVHTSAFSHVSKFLQIFLLPQIKLDGPSFRT